MALMVPENVPGGVPENVPGGIFVDIVVFQLASLERIANTNFRLLNVPFETSDAGGAGSLWGRPLGKSTELRNLRWTRFWSQVVLAVAAS